MFLHSRVSVLERAALRVEDSETESVEVDEKATANKTSSITHGRTFFTFGINDKRGLDSNICSIHACYPGASYLNVGVSRDAINSNRISRSLIL